MKLEKSFRLDHDEPNPFEGIDVPSIRILNDEGVPLFDVRVEGQVLKITSRDMPDGTTTRLCTTGDCSNVVRIFRRSLDDQFEESQ